MAALAAAQPGGRQWCPHFLSAAGGPCREAARPSALSKTARAQVCIPVPLPGRPPAGIALIGMAKSDLRLLAVAEGLGPLVAEAASALAAAAAAAGGADAAAADARRGADEGGGGGVAGPSGSAAGRAAAHANGHAGPAGRGGRPGAPLGLQDMCAATHGPRGPAWASPAASVLGEEAGRTGPALVQTSRRPTDSHAARRTRRRQGAGGGQGRARARGGGGRKAGGQRSRRGGRL